MAMGRKGGSGTLWWKGPRWRVGWQGQSRAHAAAAAVAAATRGGVGGEAAVEAMGWVLKAAVGQLTVLRTVDRTPRSARPTVFGLIDAMHYPTPKYPNPSPTNKEPNP